MSYQLVRVSPAVLRRRRAVAGVEDTPLVCDPSSLQVYGGIEEVRPYPTYLQVKEGVERLRKNWNINW